MSDPIQFAAASPRFGLPMLFAGQSQREFFVNEAFVRLDSLLHLAVEGTSDTVPAAPGDGETWIVGAAPSGAWAANAGDIATWQAGNWLFAVPRLGMTAFDITASCLMRFDGSWRQANPVSEPAGGTTVDAEARGAISDLIAALLDAGILPRA